MNLFWSIYKNLEKELILLSNNIHFCDEQNSVFSIYISDLLIRTAVEIEAISKELYKSAGGNMKPVDKNGSERELFFDTDCIQHLDKRWKITKKCVNVISSNFYFSDPENLQLRPLKNCNKRGLGRWKKAYQAVKHDRVNELKNGNIANLIRAMAALYLLNIYYRNERYDAGTLTNTTPFDVSMGSDVFSISLVHAERDVFITKPENERNHAIQAELDSAVLVQKYTDETFTQLYPALLKYNQTASDILSQSSEVLQLYSEKPSYKFKSFLSLAQDAGGNDLVKKILQDQEIIGIIPKSHMEVVLNKCQQIYSIPDGRTPGEKPH